MQLYTAPVTVKRKCRNATNQFADICILNKGGAMKLKLKKINYHKWIPARFSSFQAKLLAAFLVATLLPLVCVALVSYHVSYNLARDRITNSALMSDEQLLFQLNSRLNQTENVADTIQFQMYSFEHAPSNQIDSLKTFNSMRSNISLYKSTFGFYHIYIFLRPDRQDLMKAYISFPQISSRITESRNLTLIPWVLPPCGC